MISFPMFLLVAFLLSSSIKAEDLVFRAGLEKWSLSHESAEDYIKEHDSNEIDHSQELEYDAFIICRKNNVDRCVCNKKIGRIDCRRKTRGSTDIVTKVLPLESPALALETRDFEPKHVYLTGNVIESLDRNNLMPSMRDTLEAIDFSFNHISTINPGAFDKFKKLKELRFHHNQIRINSEEDTLWITEKLGNKLEILNLGYNSLEQLPNKAFDKLKNLRKLILDGNRKIILNDTLFQAKGLVNLDTLTLDNCNLNSLPENFFNNLPKLRFVSLIKNPLTTIPSPIQKLPLYSLDLSETKITEWAKNSLGQNISHLYMKKMPELSTIADCAFCGLKNLTMLDLSGSDKLSSMDENAFGYKKNLDEVPVNFTIIRLEDCSFTTLSGGLLKWKTIDQIALAGNPWNCDDKLKWLTHDSTLHLFTGNDLPRCASPPELNGTALQKVAPKSDQAGSLGSNFFRNIFYFGLTVAIAGMAITGILTLGRKYGFNAREILNRHLSAGGAGNFNNLNRNVDLEDEQGFVDDDDEFQPRAAAV